MPQGNIQYNPNPNQMYMQQGGIYRQPAEGEDMGYVSGRGGRGGRGRRGGRGGRGNGGRGKFNHPKPNVYAARGRIPATGGRGGYGIC